MSVESEQKLYDSIESDDNIDSDFDDDDLDTKIYVVLSKTSNDFIKMYNDVQIRKDMISLFPGKGLTDIVSELFEGRKGLLKVVYSLLINELFFDTDKIGYYFNDITDTIKKVNKKFIISLIRNKLFTYVSSCLSVYVAVRGNNINKKFITIFGIILKEISLDTCIDSIFDRLVNKLMNTDLSNKYKQDNKDETLDFINKLFEKSDNKKDRICKQLFFNLWNLNDGTNILDWDKLLTNLKKNYKYNKSAKQILGKQFYRGCILGIKLKKEYEHLLTDK